MKEKDITTKLDITKETVRSRISKDFSGIYWDKLILVDNTTTRLAIDDISYRAQSPIQENIELLQLACKGWLEVYDAEELTIALSEKLAALLRAVNTNKTIMVFPGNGAKIVRDLLPTIILDGIVNIDVSTKRTVNAKTGAVEDVEIGEKNVVRKAISDINAQTIIVLDDVIATGATLSALRDSFPARNLEWFAGSLMMLSPVQKKTRIKRESGIDGYTSIISPLIYQGVTGAPALNSLYTFIGNSEKSQIVRTKYIQNYVEDEESFCNALDAIRGKIQPSKGGAK